MPCLVQYKGIVRNDFFGDLPGVVGVHGEPWREFRSCVQKPVLQLTTVRRYVQPLEEITNHFIRRCEEMLDANQELPDDFDNEIHKWSLECELNILCQLLTSFAVRMHCKMSRMIKSIPKHRSNCRAVNFNSVTIFFFFLHSV